MADEEEEQEIFNNLTPDNIPTAPTPVVPATAAATNDVANHNTPPPSEATDTVVDVGIEEQQRLKDCFVPGANVTRIMRSVLPPSAKIADDAKEIAQQCVSEFIAFITQEANEKCRRELRKTVAAEDLMWAMSQLGFPHYVPLLSRYLEKYREAESRKTFIRGEVPPHVRRRGRDEVVVIDSSPSYLAPVREPNPEPKATSMVQDLGFADGEQEDWLARILERSSSYGAGSGEGSSSNQAGVGTFDDPSEMFKESVMKHR